VSDRQIASVFSLPDPEYERDIDQFDTSHPTPDQAYVIQLSGRTHLQTIVPLPEGSIRSMIEVQDSVWASFGQKYLSKLQSYFQSTQF